MNKGPLHQFTTLILPLLFISATCVVVLYLTNMITRDPIAVNITEQKLSRIEAVIPRPYNNTISTDFISITAPGHFGTEKPVMVFRARQEGMPVGVVIIPVHARGYSGRIALAVGIQYDGKLSGVRVISHTETKGIGDAVDQSRSDWLKNFEGHSLDTTPREKWDIKHNGGVYDQISGATITSRGVINAVLKTLEYYNANRDRLYQ